jgi:hypothetical protein
MVLQVYGSAQLDVASSVTFHAISRYEKMLLEICTIVPAFSVYLKKMEV